MGLMKTTSPARFALLAAVLVGSPVFATSLPATTASWTKASQAWSESVTLEKNSDYVGALAKMADFAQAGGDLYLVEIRSGWLSYSGKDYRAAARHYEAASQLNTNAVTPLLGLANSYHALKETSLSDKAAEAVLLRDPANYSALLLLANSALDRHDYRRSSQYYEAILKNYPEDTAALSGDGWSLLYLTKKREAAMAFQRLLTLSPSYPYAQQGYEAAAKPLITSVR